MANYEYTGQLSSGTAITGTIEADSAEDARRRLDELPVHVLSLAETPAIRSVRPLSRDDLTFFNQQLASLAETGIAMDQGLRTLAADLRRGRLKRVVEQLADDLERGTPLEDAVAHYRGLFPPLYAQVLRSGVQSNRLGSTLLNLGSHFSMMDSARRVFREAAIYPAIVLSVGFAVVWFFMAQVVPPFEQMMGEFVAGWSADPWGTPAPEPSTPVVTALLFRVARHWNQIGLAILCAAGGTALILRLLKTTQAGRAFREGLALAMPGFGAVYRSSLLARFTQAAALSTRSGHDLPTALRLAASATGSERMVRDAERLAKRVEAGHSAAESALEGGLIPALFGFVAHVSAARGQLPAALAEMARTQDELTRQRLTMLRMTLMPVVIVLTAVVIGVCVLALFMPIIGVLNALTYVSLG